MSDTVFGPGGEDMGLTFKCVKAPGERPGLAGLEGGGGEAP